MLKPQDYTIGWICAIQTELAAARAFLDEVHDAPDPVEGDKNVYLVGKMGRHNVVIAGLPHGEYGISTAATVGSNMACSFPNVRVGLMVGVGGGVPSSKHDIHLGDIVVGSTGDGTSGVWQYDYGKKLQDQDLRPTAYLNRPPTALRTAITMLQAKYDTDGHELKEDVENVLRKKRKMRPKFQRPPAETDRLYRSTFLHRSEHDCSSICADDPGNLITRRQRTDEEDDPMIHYGLIASGNQVMKDAVYRDKLATMHNIACFEMEAAGLMNHFPCLVIRGICDYADSHKNEQWQGYAAMVATAYAKDLLQQIPQTQIQAEKTISETLQGLQHAVREMIHERHREEDQEYLNRLSSVDYDEHHNDIASKREPGTGKWFLNSKEFLNWLEESENQTLFCPGMPGTGKSFLASLIVDHLREKYRNDAAVGIAVIYFDFKQQPHSALELLLSVLKQLPQRGQPLPPELKGLCLRLTRDQKRPTIDETVSVLMSILARNTKTFLIVDAIDECEWSIGRDFLSEIFGLQATKTIKVLVTSRSIPKIVKCFEGSESIEIRAADQDVRKYLSSHLSKLDIIHSHPHLREEVMTAIIGAVDGMFLLAQLHLDSLKDKLCTKTLRSALKNLPRGKDSYYSAYEKAMERIDSQMKGFKDLAHKVLAWIACAKERLTTATIQHALAIEVGTSDLDPENVHDTEVMLSVCAGLVTVHEKSQVIRLVHYTAQEFFNDTWHKWFPAAQTEIAEACLTYLLYDVFFKSEADLRKRGRTHFDLAAYDLELQRKAKYPFYQYAVRNWGHHTRESSSEEFLALKLLQDESRMSAFSRELPFPIAPALHTSNPAPPISFARATREVKAVHMAAYFGLHHVISKLLDTHFINSRGLWGRTPLGLAAAEGHEEVVKILLSAPEIHPDAADQATLRPLTWAAINGHVSVVKLLLRANGVDPQSADQYGATPLIWAAHHGHEEVVNMLIKTGKANIRKFDVTGQTALARAASAGHTTLSKTLLEAYRNFPSRGVDFSTPVYEEVQAPLFKAAETGREELLKLLISIKGVHPDGTYLGNTPLSIAIKSGKTEAVKILLATGDVDLNRKNYWGRTPLLEALEQPDIFRMLLAENAMLPDPRDYQGLTPLAHSALKGLSDNVQLLLAKRGVDPDSKDDQGRTPLVHAAIHGRLDIAKLLLETEAVDPNSEDSLGRTPLIGAIQRGHGKLVKLLLATPNVNRDIPFKFRHTGCRTLLLTAVQTKSVETLRAVLANTSQIDLNRTGWNDRSPLSRVASNGTVEMMHVLLLAGRVDLDSRDNTGRTPLSWAAAKGNFESVQCLLGMHGVDPNSRDNMGRTPLWWAVRKRRGANPENKQVLEMLLRSDRLDPNLRDDTGRTPLALAVEKKSPATAVLVAADRIDLDTRDEAGRTPLSRAAEKGYSWEVQQLITTKRVNLESRDNAGQTPLLWAVRSGHTDIVEILLANGADPSVKDNDGQTPLSWSELGDQLRLSLQMV